MDDVRCTVCGNNHWVNDNEYPAIRKCATPNCSGIHPLDVAKLRSTEGLLYDDDKREYIDMDELEKPAKK